MDRTEIAIVGAGPAGLSAALEASRAGARVTIIDEYSRPGGQYFKQPPSSFKLLDRSLMGRDYQAGQELLSRISDGNITLMSGTLVWGAFSPDTLELYQEERGECLRLSSDRTIIATGAYDRPIAFPGWTLPGVITAGAAHSLVKSQFVLPGSRVLLAGSGPFQLPVASQLLKGGAQVVAVLEAGRVGGWVTRVPAIWRHLDKVNEAKDYLGAILKARVPYEFGWTVIEARGKDHVEDAVISQLDENYHPISGTERVLQVDTICLGFGFIPSLQLPRLLGCESAYDKGLSAWVTACDENQATSVQGVYVAGETTGIGGHDVAMCEGAVAGLRAASDIGKIGSDEAEDRLSKVRGNLKNHREFSSFLNRTFSLRPGIFELAREDTILCRCEEVTLGEVEGAAMECGGSIRTIKQLTRAGMGPCQGRICGSLVAQVATRISGNSIAEIAPDTPRPPIKPIPLGALAKLAL